MKPVAVAQNLVDCLPRLHFGHRQRMGRSVGFDGTLLKACGRLYTLYQPYEIGYIVCVCIYKVPTLVSSLFGQPEFRLDRGKRVIPAFKKRKHDVVYEKSAEKSSLDL